MPVEAELEDGQFDPFNFDLVSPLVDEIVEHRRSKKELIGMSCPKDVVEDTYRRIRSAEYKRWKALVSDGRCPSLTSMKVEG